NQQIDRHDVVLESALRSLDGVWKPSRGAPWSGAVPSTVRAVRRPGSRRVSAILLVGLGLAVACTDVSPNGVAQRPGPLATTTTSAPERASSTPSTSSTTPASNSGSPAPSTTNARRPIEPVEPTLGVGDALFPGLGSSDIDAAAYHVALTYDPRPDRG